jgi:hypothetical protein
VKLRYIVLGMSVFVWSAVIADLITGHFDIENLVGRPVLYFVLAFSGVLMGYGIGKGGN